MPAGRILEPNEIYLNGNKYHISSIVEKASSTLPPKQVFGDFSKTSDPTKSQVVFSDWRDGMGQFYLDEFNPTRPWWAWGQIRHKGHFFLPFEQTDTNDLATPNASVIGFIIASDVLAAGTLSIFAPFGNVIYSYADGGAWTLRYTIAGSPASVTDAVTLEMGGTVYLVVAHTGGYCYTSNGTGWTNDTTNANIQYLASWNDNLWMISNTGQLYYSSTIGTEVADAKLPLEQSVVSDLFVGPDANGEPILYAATTKGLFAHDFINTRFVATGLQLPDNSRNGNGCCVWQGNIYYPSNMGVYEYSPRNGIIRAMGLDRADGLTAVHIGYIKRLEPSLYELLALVDCSGTTSGKTAIFGWDGKGWEMKWRQGGTIWNADSLYVSSTYTSYRIWFGAGVGGASPDRKVRYIKIPTNWVNPAQLGTLFNYGLAGLVFTPWFTGSQDNVDKIALTVKVDISLPANTVFTLYYYRDWSTTATTMALEIGTEPGAGNRVLSYPFPPTGDAVGIAFRAIQFEVDLATTNAARTPDLRSLTLEFVPKLRIKRQWLIEVDLNEEYNGNTPGQQRANLLTALGAQVLVEFTYRDDTGNTQNYFVLVFQDNTSVITGHDESGKMLLNLVEP